MCIFIRVFTWIESVNTKIELFNVEQTQELIEQLHDLFFIKNLVQQEYFKGH